MQEDTYQYAGRHLINMEEGTKLVWRKTLMHINEGNPLFARESCICNEGNAHGTQGERTNKAYLHP